MCAYGILNDLFRKLPGMNGILSVGGMYDGGELFYAFTDNCQTFDRLPVQSYSSGCIKGSSALANSPCEEC